MFLRDQLAGFCSGLRFDDLPRDVVEFTRLLITDQVGVTIAGARNHLNAGDADVAAFFKELGGKGESSLVGEGCKVPCLNAAYCNTVVGFGGDAMHRSAVHLSCLVPAAIAAAERQQASGKDLILATVAGVEVIARVAQALGSDSVYNRGFHPTSLCAPFGCAVAAGKLLGLGKAALSEALSIAATQAAGSSLWPQLPHAPRTTRTQVGNAAQSGVMAALLARLGVVGAASIFEDPRGFLAGHSANPDPARLTSGLGTVWEVKNTTFKRFWVGIYNVPGLEALLWLMREHRIRPEDIQGMTYKLPTAVVPLVGSPDYPLNDSMKSSRYVLAVTAYKGEKGMLLNREYQNEANLKDPGHIELFKLIDVVADPELDKFFPGKWPCVLTVRTRDGREFTRFHDQPAKGEPENPFTPREIEAKFRKVVSPVMNPDKMDRLLAILRHLEDVDDISEMASLMASK
ncbi:MAG: MmgE/PrpD family protein [Chloroflexi bacterium]|nr:MmgE/PrpD family protein [Chloroflexota bacterium]